MSEREMESCIDCGGISASRRCQVCAKRWREGRDAAVRADEHLKKERYYVEGLTRLLEEHPEGWDGPCECAECVRSGGDYE